MAELTLRNSSGIPDEWLKRVVNAAQLPKGKLLLVVGESRPPGNGNFGECIPKRYLKTGGRTVLKVSRYRKLNWDIGVIIYNRATALFETAPGFLAYLIGHELGHAAACLIDPEVHVQYCLLQDSIVEASDGAIDKWHQLPHERWCDEFGITVATKVVGRDQLEEDIAAQTSSDDAAAERNKTLLDLGQRDSMVGLRQELVAFTRPYKTRVDKILRIRRRRSEEANADCLTRVIADVTTLYE